MTTFLFLYPVYIVLVKSKFSYKSLNVLIFPPTEWSILEIEGVLARREEPWYLSIYLLSNRSGDWRQTSNIKLSICLLTPEWRQQVLAEGALDTSCLVNITAGFWWIPTIDTSSPLICIQLTFNRPPVHPTPDIIHPALKHTLPANTVLKYF